MQSLIDKKYLRYAEYTLLVIIIGLIVLFLLYKVENLQKDAERMKLIGEINSMRAGVIAAIDNPPFDLDQVDHPHNPVHILKKPPKNYLGVIRDPKHKDIPAGSWYFDPKESVLVFKARFEHTLPFFDKPRQRIELRLMRTSQLRSDAQEELVSRGAHVCLTSP